MIMVLLLFILYYHFDFLLESVQKRMPYNIPLNVLRNYLKVRVLLFQIIELRKGRWGFFLNRIVKPEINSYFVGS